MKVMARDAAGASVSSGWSPAYVVVPPPDTDTLIALLPVENLSGNRAPLRGINRLLRTSWSEAGFRLLDDEVLEDFMRRHRVRHTGGVSSRVSRAIEEETATEATLVTSLEAYEDTASPGVSLASRLISSGEEPEIVCMEGVGLSGEGFAGLLGLGRVTESQILLERAVVALRDALVRCMSTTTHRIAIAPAPDDADLHATCEGTDICPALGDGDGDDRGGVCGGADRCPNQFFGCGAERGVTPPSSRNRARRRYLPREFYRSSNLDMTGIHTVAVIPFLNLSDRKNAGEIMTLHFVNQLLRHPRFAVTEPGLLREQLLKYRIIMEAGPSLANTDIIASRSALNVDLLFSGTVFDYQDAVGVPKVDFSVKIIDKDSRAVVWASRSYNSGDQGVFFFDLGRVYMAHRLAAQMAGGTLQLLIR